MRCFLCTLVLILAVGGCRKAPETADNGDSAEISLFTFQGTPNVLKLEGEAISISSNWKEFAQLERGFDVMFQATTKEDLILAINDLLDSEKVLREGEYPEKFDTAKIKSRQKVFRTFLLKIKAGLANNLDVTEGLKQMLSAYNALRNQMNSIVNNTLDTELILNESF
ncbi:hypothetical protein [Croceivirga thetidis]|uniref:Uncharacterized protein n=1 Tax=Croceivirga thetidis TaxID=2721623 RepID=A0ABX1GLV1_9FLAO|nr:hypothetical protein [Croceivirga thetidis]NKI30887.1 hypothetical protein [Croceivirga thetidis]